MQSLNVQLEINLNLLVLLFCLCLPGATNACKDCKENIVPGHVVTETPVVSKCFLSVMRLRLSSVCTQGDLACDPAKTQQAGLMMQPVTAWLSLFYLENTSHLPPNPFTTPLTQMCHQLHAESEECCLKLLSLYTGRLIVPVPLPAPQEFRRIIT